MKQVEIYTKPTCGFCHAAKRLLREKGVRFVEYDLFKNPSLRPTMISRAKGRQTVPQIFIDNVHIGGCDDLLAIARVGRLDQLLSD